MQITDGQTRRRLATHERLYEAAVALITERGYEATTVDDIAARAGTSRRTLFNHFPTKSDIALEWARRRRAHAAAAAPGTADPLDRLRAYFRGLAAVTEARPVETREMLLGYLGARGPVLNPSPMGQELGAWWGEQGPGSRVVLAAEVAYDVYMGALWRWMRDPAPQPGAFALELDRAVDIAIHGIAASVAESGRQPVSEGGGAGF